MILKEEMGGRRRMKQKGAKKATVVAMQPREVMTSLDKVVGGS